MKCRKLVYLAVMTLFAALAMTVPQVAQEASQQKHSVTHHHYKLVDMGAFGGPESYISGFEYQAQSQNLNNRGILTGWADTSTLDPYRLSGNSYGNFCFNYDGSSCHVSHAFQWQNGVKTDLGTLPGGSSSATAWISANGLIAGTSQNGETDPLDPGFPDDHAVLWQNGNITDLGTLPGGGYESGAQAVNSRGMVVGWALNTTPDPYSMALWSALFDYYEPIYPYQARAFLWQGGAMRDLGTLGTGTDAFAMAINEPGQVIGISYTNSAPNQITTPCSTGPIPTQDPFLWEKRAGMIDLGTLGGTCGFPFWINTQGQVVGYSDLAGDQAQHPFLWTKTSGMQDLGTLGGSSGTASMINALGEIVGGATLPNDSQLDAFLWDGTMHDLGAIDGCSYAFSINARRQIVGNTGTDCGTTGFLWENGGPMVDLNTLVSSKSVLTVQGVININDHGEIAGIGVAVNDRTYAILLIPCDAEHPNLAGCDYSLVDATDATRASPAPFMRKPTSPNQKLSVDPMFRQRLGLGRFLPNAQKPDGNPL